MSAGAVLENFTLVVVGPIDASPADLVPKSKSPVPAIAMASQSTPAATWSALNKCSPDSSK